MGYSFLSPKPLQKASEVSKEVSGHTTLLEGDRKRGDWGQVPLPENFHTDPHTGLSDQRNESLEDALNASSKMRRGGGTPQMKAHSLRSQRLETVAKLGASRKRREVLTLGEP